MHDKDIEQLSETIAEQIEGKDLPIEVYLSDIDIPYHKILYLYSLLKKKGYRMFASLQEKKVIYVTISKI